MVLHLLKSILVTIQAFIVPICFVSAWVIMMLTVWSLWSTVQDTARRTRQLHRIPCSQCLYFTNSYHLKCTVHPAIALSEAAIDCKDYKSKEPSYCLADSSELHDSP